MNDDPVLGPKDVASLGTIVGVWAHPDDEAFLSAGLMALARDAGSRVVVVTATRGEYGGDDPITSPPDRLGKLRADELGASLAAVGVSEHRWLGHIDGTCRDVPVEVGVSQVRRVLDAVLPETVVTFGPDGLTGHDDHRAISEWATIAWELAGRSGRLLYATTTETWALEFGDLNDRFEVFSAGLPVVTPDDALALRLSLTGDVLDRKMSALRAHASQVATLHREVGHETFGRWWAEESFRDAAVRPVGGISATPP